MHKIVSYSFAVSAPLDLGEPSSFEMVGEPGVLLRPRRVLCNWTEDDSVTVTSFRCGNVEMFVGYPLSITYPDRPIVLRRTVWYRIVRFFKRLFRLAVESDEYRPPLDLPVIGHGIPVRNLRSVQRRGAGRHGEGLLLYADGLDPWGDTGCR